MLSTSKIEEVSQTCFVFDFVNVEFLRKPCRTASFRNCHLAILKEVFHNCFRERESDIIYIYTISTAQGGGGSFKNRKPIGEVGCCDSGMAERSHWWTERCLRYPLFLSPSRTICLPTCLSSMYLSICRSISLSLSSNYLSIYLSVYRSIYLSLSLSLFHLSSCLPVYLPTVSFYLSIYLSLSFFHLSICLAVYLSIYPSIYLSVYLSTCLSIYLSVCLSIDQILSLSLYLYIYISVCLSICLSTWLCLFDRQPIYFSICLGI